MKAMIVVLLFCVLSIAYAFATAMELPPEVATPTQSETTISSKIDDAEANSSWNSLHRIKRGDPCHSENTIKHVELGLKRGAAMGRDIGGNIGKGIPFGKKIGKFFGGAYGAFFGGAAGAVYQATTCTRP